MLGKAEGGPAGVECMQPAVAESIQAGARDFIVKPFKPDAVLATLRAALEKEL